LEQRVLVLELVPVFFRHRTVDLLLHVCEALLSRSQVSAFVLFYW
jgi:hypothetical protein